MYNITASNKFSKIKYSVMDTIDKAHQAKKNGKEIFYLHIGDPILFDFDTPSYIIDSVYEAMQNRRTGYTETSGIQEAIDSIHAVTAKKGVENINEIYITNGVSEAIDICFAALLNNGDNILIPKPSYPLYATALYKHGGEPIYYNLDEDNNWEPDVEEIEKSITDKTRAIVLINPNNPTGTVYGKEIIEKVIAIAEKHKLMIFSDEIYDNLIIDEGVEHYSPAELNSEIPVVILNGMSKSYLAPGFRLGWCVVCGNAGSTKDFRNAVGALTRARLCANYAEQYAIKPALESGDPHLAEVKRKLKARRDITFERLNAIEGISCVKPQAAFYAFPKIDSSINDIDFVHNLISETGVVTTHGTGFGQKNGTSHFRVVYLDVETRLAKAYGMIDDFVKKHY